MNEKVNNIMDKLYKTYGTDTGILFGITDKNIVEAIVDFTLNEV